MEARHYVVPALIAVLLHSFLAYSLNYTLNLSNKENESTFRPRAFSASLVQLNELSPIKRSPRNVRPTFTSPSTEFESQTPEPELDRTEQDTADDLAAERNRILQELRDQTLELSVANERDQLLEDYISTKYDEYFTDIYIRVVQNWVRPPKARNGMEAILQVELFPNGKVNSVGILKSSGYLAFDRSALSAVRKAAPFRVPKDIDAFDSTFRSLHLRFKPEDLVR